jgi:hypothetical protein
VNPSPWPDTDAAERVVIRFRKFVDVNYLNEAGAPASWSRFGENVVKLVRSYKPGSQSLNDAVDELLDSIEAEFAAGKSAPVSATFFQFVVGFVGRSETPGHLRKHRIVPSSEYAVLGLPDGFQKEFLFDGTAGAE